MKRIFISFVFVGCLCAGCTPQRWFLVNTNGILTYNRHTGQLECIWEWNEKPQPIQRDTVDVISNSNDCHE